MMMHHDSQPLYSAKGNYGLLNQIKILRKAGAVSLQVLMMTPSAGTKLYEQTFTGKQVFKRVAGKPVLPHMYDGNYVIASSHKYPWLKQLNMLIGYASFYNPLRLAANLVGRRSKVKNKAAGMQLIGMLGLIQTVRRTATWAIRLMLGNVERLTESPRSAIPMRSVGGETGCHAPMNISPAPLVRGRRPVSLPIAS
jgi:hypothetical protein